jgi:acyl carrier protein
MTPDSVRTEIHTFIQKNFLFDDSRTVDDEQSLLGSGIVDSTGILELIGYLETMLQIKFADSELVADNFDSVAKILRFITPRLNGKQ